MISAELFFESRGAATYLTFCIYLAREIIFLSGQGQGKVRVLKTDVCGNHV